MLSHFKPASLQQLVLISFAVALIPLGVLLWQGHSALKNINSRAMQEAQEAIRHARQVENMDNLAVNVERTVRQYEVVRNQTTRSVASHQIGNYNTDLLALCSRNSALGGVPACQSQKDSVRLLRDRFTEAPSEELDTLLREFRSQQRHLTHLIWQQLNTRLMGQRQYVQRQQRNLSYQTLGLVLLTLLLVVWSSSRIAAPIRRLDRRIRSIGQPNHTSVPANIDGPRELNELGERLNWLSGRLQRLESLRLAFLRHASHELKTPLASIKEGSSLLIDDVIGRLNSRQREVLNLLNASADRLIQLTEQLLDYNQLLQQSEVKIEHLDLRELLDELTDQHELGFAKRGQVFDVECELDGLDSNPVLLQRILDNLLSNAKAYGAQNGRVRLRITRAPPNLILEVANTGPTIPEQQRERLFEPFQRGETPRMDAVQGSGLGLSVVADSARLLEGRVELTEAEGFDVCVRVYLPIKENTGK